MISTLIRTTVLYFFVTLAIRLMGKRQIGDMQPNELVITLLISEIAAIPLQDSNQPVLNGILAVLLLVFLEIVISVLVMKFASLRSILSGSSILIIKNGIIDQKAMKKVRITIIELVELLRSQGYFDTSEVAWAILEVNGNLSVIPKAHKKPVEVGDLPKAKEKKPYMPLPVISDGVFIDDSIKALNLTKEKIIEISGEKTEKNIFLMTLDQNGSKTVVLKEKF